MKKTLVLLGILTTMFIGAKSFAACPCANPCPTACPTVCPAATCPTTDCTCPAPCCDTCTTCQRPKCKCTWWKIFEDKTCCYKCNNECNSCYSAKRAHWYKFWTDRCVVPNVKCNGCGCACK